MPLTRISFDTNVFATGNSDQIPKPQPAAIPQQYQTMHANFNLNVDQRSSRANPLLKTSKISHSAKDIIKAVN